MFIDVFTDSGLHKRSRSGINYPYVFPDGKEIDDKIPTVNISSGGFSSFDGGPYPAFSAGPIHTWSDVSTLVRGRHTFKAGVQVEYSGEDDFDQINVNATPGGTNNQNGAFTFTDSARRRNRPVDLERRARACSATTPSSDSATSRSGARSRPTCSFRTPGSRERT